MTEATASKRTVSSSRSSPRSTNAPLHWLVPAGLVVLSIIPILAGAARLNELVGDPILESNLTRRVDSALFMVAAIENDDLVHEAPAIVGRQTPSALAHANLVTA